MMNTTTTQDPIFDALLAIAVAAARTDDDGTHEAMAIAGACDLIQKLTDTPVNVRSLQTIAIAAAGAARRGNDDFTAAYMAIADAHAAIRLDVARAVACRMVEASMPA